MSLVVVSIRLVALYNTVLLSVHSRGSGDERCDRKWYPVERTYSGQGDQGESHPRELLQQSDSPTHRTETKVRRRHGRRTRYSYNTR